MGPYAVIEDQASRPKVIRNNAINQNTFSAQSMEAFKFDVDLGIEAGSHLVIKYYFIHHQKSP